MRTKKEIAKQRELARRNAISILELESLYSIYMVIHAARHPLGSMQMNSVVADSNSESGKTKSFKRNRISPTNHRNIPRAIATEDHMNCPSLFNSDISNMSTKPTVMGENRSIKNAFLRRVLIKYTANENAIKQSRTFSRFLSIMIVSKSCFRHAIQA